MNDAPLPFRPRPVVSVPNPNPAPHVLSIHRDIHKFRRRYAASAAEKIESLPLKPPAGDIPDYYNGEVDGRPALAATLEASGKAVRLDADQQPHFNRVVAIALRRVHGHAIDTSQPGTGKTYILFAVAMYLGMAVFALTPKTVKSKWRTVAAEFGVPLLYVETYETFRGRAHHALSHPYLVRHDVSSSNDAGDVSIATTFEATQVLRDLIASQRVLFVFDEVQKIKDPKADVTQACHALAAAIPLDSASARAMCLSRTAIEKTKFSESILRMCGVLRGPLYTYVASFGGGATVGTPEWHAMVERARAADADHTAMILSHHRLLRAAGFRHVAWLLFRDVFRPWLVSEMPRHALTSVRMDVANGFYTFDAATEQLISFELDAIARCLHLERNAAGRDVVDMAGMALATPHMMELQRLKTPMFAALTRWYLAVVPNARVILFVTFKCVAAALMSLLTDLAPALLNGDCNERQRDESMARFQDPSSDCRVIISNPRVGGVGIDLDDKTGTAPRAMFLMPDFNINDLIQAIWRGMRRSTRQADPDVVALFARFVYTNTPNGAEELRILQLLHEKASVINQTLAEQDENLFPSRNIRYDAAFASLGEFDYVPLLRKPTQAAAKEEPILIDL